MFNSGIYKQLQKIKVPILSKIWRDKTPYFRTKMRHFDKLSDLLRLKFHLAKSISDAGWGMFETLLKYKAEWEGKIYIEVDRFFPSSKTCHVCLTQVGSLPLNIREWACGQCHT
jgi:transposase